jgi:hypothetical protein
MLCSDLEDKIIGYSFSSLITPRIVVGNPYRHEVKAQESYTPTGGDHCVHRPPDVAGSHRHISYRMGAEGDFETTHLSELGGNVERARADPTRATTRVPAPTMTTRSPLTGRALFCPASKLVNYHSLVANLWGLLRI